MKFDGTAAMEAGNKVLSYLGHAGAALNHLLHSYEYARDVGCDAWEFALDFRCLQRDGLRESDLRWLLLKGLVEQAYEQTQPTDTSRRFRPQSCPLIEDRSCFLLNDAGAEIIAQLIQAQALMHDASRNGASNLERSPQPAKPNWDRDRRELLWLDQVIKQFKVAAPNQETILAAFQEEQWPTRIDDPLSPTAETESKRRLHDTIVSLNRNRKSKIVRFLGDGSGEGIRWEVSAQHNGHAVGL